MAFISMSICSKINSETAKDICSALHIKYGEDFIVTHIGDRFNNNTAKTYVHPKNNSDIVFTATIDHDGNVTDDYVNNLVMDQIEKDITRKLDDYGIKASVNAVVTEDDVFETDREITPNRFAENNGIDSILVRIIIDYNNEDADKIISALEYAAEGYSFDLVIGVYFMNQDSYVLCDNDFKTYPSVGHTVINSYKPLFSIRTIVSGGKSSVKSSELALVMEDR